jgi:hypothetical protein
LADGVAKITTTEGVDYAFIGRAPLEFQRDEVSFTGIAGAVRVYADEIHLIIAEGPAAVRYRGVALKSPVPCTKVIPLAETESPRTIEIPDEKPVISFALDPNDGPIAEAAPGVRKQTLADGVAYAIESDARLDFSDGDVSFVGKRGGVVVDRKLNTVRRVLLAAERIKVGDIQAWGEEGHCDLTFASDRVVGHTAGRGRHLYLTPPSGLDRLPMLVLDGQTYAPGTSGRTLNVPVLSGEHRFELRALPQPPVFRNWQAW